jgi:hypothetical protein
LSNRFEDRFNECLEALLSGQRSLEDCLSMYPEDSDRLEPMLRAAMMLCGAFAAKPRPQFAASARERFLRVTPPRLRESLAFEPRPSFVMAAKQRFLVAAQKMAREKQAPRWWPEFLTGRRAFRVAQFASAAAAVFVMGFGGFAVSTSADALPGDWQYPVKRTVEDVRYTLTFSEGGKKQLDIEYTQERLSEVQKLAENGRPIGEGPLKDLADQTGSLVNRLDNNQLDNTDAKKVEALAQQQQQVLADPALPVEPGAGDELVQAKKVSTEAMLKAGFAVTGNDDGKETPEAAASPTTAATASSTPTAGPTEAGAPAETAVPATPTPAVPEVTPIPDTVVVARIKNENDAGVSWNLAVIDRFSVEVPSEASGWRFIGVTIGPDGTAEAPFMLRVVNADASTIVVIDPRNGDTFWEQYFSDGLFHEYRVRMSDGPIVWQASDDELNAFYPGTAAIVSHIINSVKIEPPPTPTPEPTATPTPGPADTATNVTPSP